MTGGGGRERGEDGGGRGEDGGRRQRAFLFLHIIGSGSAFDVQVKM